MSIPVKTKKKKIRKQMLRQRSLLSPAAKAIYDQNVCEALWHLMEQKRCQTVHTYLPMGSEINIFPFIKQCLAHQKTVICPQTLPKRRFINLILTSLQDLEPGVFGTKHPAGKSIFEGTYDMIVVPGLACDGDRCRLGYGGGYYDTFVADCPKAHKVGVFYPFQQIDKIPLEPHDMQLNDLLVCQAWMD
ncbi:5-formyltetrahydrofolate cyclo-ligase [Flagellimonas ruestringensis]|nr:5-formyltetrahydrofolate cyclo-ligase [Allomuricauda ruestringensis]